MKKAVLAFILSIISLQGIYAQCSTNEVEAVRNGDFDAGYIPGDFNTDHTWIGGTVDPFIGQTNNTTGCNWATANQIYISSNDIPYSCGWANYVGTPMNPDYGRNGIDGGGDNILYVDPMIANDATVWEQTVTVQPGQNYFFSFWYLSINNPAVTHNNFNLKFDGANQTVNTGITETFIVTRRVPQVDGMGQFITDALGNLIYDTITGPVSWTQTYAEVMTGPAQTSATIGIHMTGGVQTNGYEFAVDKISFINSCQNLTSNSRPVFPADTINLCAGATASLSPTYNDNGSTANNTYTWFKDGVVQAGETSLAFGGTVDEGTYTLCVEDPDNGCPVSVPVVIQKQITATLPAGIDLCSPAQATLTPTITPSGATFDYSWTVPGGATDPGNSASATANVAGTYTVTVSNSGVAGCSDDASTAVTSSAPTPPTGLTYCSGGGVDVSLTVGDGNSYNWSTDVSMTPVVASGVTATYSVPAGTTGDITLYMQNNQSTPLGSAVTSATSWDGPGDPMTITVTQTVMLESVEMVFPGYTTGPQTLTLDGNTVNFNASGTTTVPINTLLTPGSYTISYGGNSNIMTTTTGSIAGYVSISGGANGSFRNFIFSESSACDPIPVTITEQSCCTQEEPTVATTQAVCVGETVNLTATPNPATTGTIEYQWYSNAGGSDNAIPGATSATYSVPTTGAMAATEFWATVTASASCTGPSDSSNAVTVTVNDRPTTPTITVDPNQTNFCQGTAHTLTAASTVTDGGTITYNWSNAITATGAAQNGVVAPAAAYTYKVVATSNGCSDSLETTITIDPLDSAEITVDTVTSCANSGNVDLAALLTAGTTAGGTWSGTGVTGSDFSTAQVAGVYKILYTTSGTCSEADSVYMNVVGSAEAQIVQGDTSVCRNTAAFPLPLTGGSATDGTWSGTGYSAGNFDPAGLTDGAYTIKYVKNGVTAACSDSDSVVVTINPLDSALIATPLPSLCSTDPPAQLNLGSGATTGGNWTDSLAANTYVNATGIFDPTGLTDGLYKVIYNTPGACPSSDSGYVTVTSNISYALQPSQQTTYCLNYGLDTLDVDVAGGEIWTKSGNGVVSASERIFNTNLMTPGTDTLWYGKAGSCGDTIAYEITINPIDTAEIDTVMPVCQDTTAITLTITGSATGGTWAGNGVAGDQFTAGTAGVGTHMITYTTAGNCPIVDTTWIEVRERKDATITADTVAFCGASIAATMSSAQGGGTWSGWAGKWTTVTDTLIIFDPNANANSGTEMLYYTIVDQCGAIDSVSVSITAMEEAYVAAAGPFCEDEAATTMAFDGAQGTTTPGGTWSGPGITDGATGAFDPATAGPGNHWIKYVTPGGCTDSDSVQVLVKPRMDATITTQPLIFCEGSATPAAAVATDMGGSWKGWTGAHTTATDNQIIFDPAASGSGTGQLVYEIDESTAVCGDTDSVAVTVTAKDSALITGNLTFCQASPAEALNLSGGTTAGGIWSGTGITDAGTGMFDPGVAGSGNHGIKYLTTGACPDSSEVTATVVASVDVVIDAVATDTILCSNQSDPTVIQTGTTGGTWSSTPTGLVDAASGVINIAAMAGQGAGTYEIKYEAGPGGNCYDADSINVRMIEVATPSITGAPSGSVCVTAGSHQLTGVDGEAATWTVTSGAGSVDNTGLVSFSTSGDITVSYTHTGEGECPATPATQTINVIDPANTNIIDIADQCDNNGVTPINSQGGLTTGVRWWIEDENGGSVGPAVANVSSIDFNAGWGEGTYTIYQEIDNGCLDTGTIEVIVSAAPSPILSADDSTLCEGVPVTITVDNGGATAQSATWSYTHSNVIDTITSTDLNNTTRSFDDEGLVTVTVIQSFTNGCTVTTTESDWLSVDSIPRADFSFGPQPTTILDPYITFTNESSVSDDLLWSFTPDSARSAVSVPTHGVNVSEYVEFLSEDGDTFPVTLVVTSPNGCTDTITKDVIILNNVSIYVPNSFTPNGDGLNDVFYPGGKYHDNPDGLEDYEFYIFNRWGEVVFQSTTPYLGWDGTYMNTVVQQDVYTWQLKVFDPAVSKVIVSTGTVTVVR